MLNNYCVYKHTFQNGKCYIGITRQNPIKRWKRGNGYFSNTYFYNAIKKHGWDNIKHEILFTNLSKEDAEKKEIELISFFNSANRKYGYNIKIGGNTRGYITEETKSKMRLSHLGKKTKPRSKELKTQHSKYMKEHWKDETFKAKLMDGLIKHHCIKVECVETGKTFISLREASKFYKLSHKYIGDCLKGKRKTVGGYHWRKVGDSNA